MGWFINRLDRVGLGFAIWSHQQPAPRCQLAVITSQSRRSDVCLHSQQMGAMSAQGQTEKVSQRAFLDRYTPESGRPVRQQIW
jgi:hypothetical protein